MCQANVDFGTSGSGEGTYKLGKDGKDLYVSNDKANFIFDPGNGVDLLYLWCLADQCDIFKDILVDIGELGGSSNNGVNGALSKKRTRGEGKNNLESQLARIETNDILRSLADRGKENISMKVNEISLHRNTLKELNSEIRETIKMLVQVDVGDEFNGEIRGGLEMLRVQVKKTQSDLTEAELELSSLKLNDKIIRPSSKKMKQNIMEVAVSSDSDSTEGVLDDESKSDGESSLQIDFHVDPDAAEGDVDAD